MTRKFSIPYVFDEKFLNTFLPYKESIDNVYSNIPFKLEFLSHRTNVINIQNKDVDAELEEYLMNSYGKFKRIVALNNALYPEDNQELLLKVKSKLIPWLIEYKIDGIIMTNFYIAYFIKQKLPDIEIHTSCNGFQFAIPHMKRWQESLDVKVFNPPREILRMPNLLKEMKNEGFTIKALVNESCLFGCPNFVYHANLFSINKNLSIKSEISNCSLGNPENFWKSNWILPRWLPLLDPYCDIFKISGRGCSLDEVFKSFIAYYNLDNNVNLLDLIIGVGTSSYYQNSIVPVNEISDKLLTCECKDCKDCNICKNLTNKFLK